MLDIVSTLKEFNSMHLVSHIVGGADLIFIFKDSSLAVLTHQGLPRALDLNLVGQSLYCFGSLSGVYCCFYEALPQEIWPLVFTPIKALQDVMNTKDYALASLAHHLYHWRSLHAFCGRCGAHTSDVLHERAKQCPACASVVYPRISPCVIVLIRHGRKILLARSPHFKPGVFSLLAGFIEPGESAEQAVVREVKEEVGLGVKNIQYVLSQPWPFPDSLMLGFFADYAEGDLEIDGHEIEAGAWYTPENLPDLPSSLSISRYLIERFLSECQNLEC